MLPHLGRVVLNAMPERVDARDVLDANARTARAFLGTAVGYFRRTGPNSWDDYEFVRSDPEPVEVLPGVRVQVERRGTEIRLRRHGQVARIRWDPGAADPPELANASSQERREYFVATYLADFDDAPGIGAAAWIARKLR